MTTDRRLKRMDGQQRRIEVAKPYDRDLGPLQQLPGKWVGTGHGVEHDRPPVRGRARSTTGCC